MSCPTALIGLSSQLDQNSFDVSTRGTQRYMGFAGEVQVNVLLVNAGYHLAMSTVFRWRKLQYQPEGEFLPDR